MEDQAQLPGQGVGRQMGSDGHGEKFEARAKNSRLWRKDCLIDWLQNGEAGYVLELGIHSMRKWNGMWNK